MSVTENMNKNMRIAFIALGGNLSNPKDNFIGALGRLEAQGLSILSASSLWHSPAWPRGLGYPDYINAVVKVSSDLNASDLLNLLHVIEGEYGRERKQVNAPRPLDLDIIDYEGQVNQQHPILPHPRLHQRPFVLLPLLEIAPDWTHPVTSCTALQSLARIEPSEVFTHHVIERDWLKSLACV